MHRHERMVVEGKIGDMEGVSIVIIEDLLRIRANPLADVVDEGDADDDEETDADDHTSQADDDGPGNSADTWPGKMAVPPTAASHIVFTSGSTGQPKGVVCEHRALYSFSVAKNKYHGIGPGARVLMASAITWDPSVGDVYPTLAAGATLCVAPRALVLHDLSVALNVLKVSHTFATPSLWSLLKAGPQDVPHLRVVALGGEPIPVAVVNKWSPCLRLINTYGVTECTVCQTAVDTFAGCPAQDVGRPFEDAIMHIEPDPSLGGWSKLDAGGASSSDVDSPTTFGRLYIGGQQVGRGYLNNQPETDARFITATFKGVTQRWFDTGDLARWTPQGNIELAGRADNQIKLRGFRIELGEIEQVVLSSNLVEACVVTKCSTPDRLVAYVVPLSSTLTTAAFMQGGNIAVWLMCKRVMPAHQVPTQFVCVDSFPLTGSGKVDRRALPDAPKPAPRGADGQQGTVASGFGLEGNDEHTLRTPTERVLGKVWEDILHVEGVGPYDHFFELGASSLDSLHMIEVLADRLRADPEACSAAYVADTDHKKVRLCGLHRKPRLRDYASLLDWAALAAPNRSAKDTSAFQEMLGGAGAGAGAGTAASEQSASDASATDVDEGGHGQRGLNDLLAQLDLDLPSEADEMGRGADAMSLSCQHNHVGVVTELLRLNISPNGRVSRGNKANTPMMIAASHGHDGLVRLLLDSGAQVNLTNRSQATAAHLAAMHCTPALADLLARGAAIDARDLNKWTCMHYAAWVGNTRSITELVHQNARINAKDRWGRTALNWAVFGNHPDVVQQLLASGASFNALHENGSAPQAKHQRRTDNLWSGNLHLALQAASTADDKTCAMLSLLLEHGCAVDEVDSDGRTAMHEAAGMVPSQQLQDASTLDGVGLVLEGSVGHCAAQRLAASKCSLIIADHTGKTSLQVAVIAGNVPVVALLLQHGANPNLPSSELIPAVGPERDVRDQGAAGTHDSLGEWPLQESAVQQCVRLCADAVGPWKQLQQQQQEANRQCAAAKSSETDEHLGGNPKSKKSCRKFNTDYPCDRLEKRGTPCIFGHFCSTCGGHHSAQFCDDKG